MFKKSKKIQSVNQKGLYSHFREEIRIYRHFVCCKFGFLIRVDTYYVSNTDEEARRNVFRSQKKKNGWSAESNDGDTIVQNHITIIIGIRKSWTIIAFKTPILIFSYKAMFMCLGDHHVMHI